MCDKFLKVFVFRLPEQIEYKCVYPPERCAEISSCGNLEVKKQKYTAWLLLKRVVEEKYGIPFESVHFTKTKNGKWLADKFSFSISHTKNYVAVCVDNEHIGLDIEELSPKNMTEKLFCRIATDKEKQAYSSLSVEDIATLWTKKEAIFKKNNGSFFIPKTIETQGYKSISVINKDLNLAISVSGEISEISVIFVGNL